MFWTRTCLLLSNLFFISDFKPPPLAPALTLLLRWKSKRPENLD
jgi:hypothetical protein